MMMKKTGLLAVLTAGVLLFAGCGKGKNGSPGGWA